MGDRYHRKHPENPYSTHKKRNVDEPEDARGSYSKNYHNSNHNTQPRSGYRNTGEVRTRNFDLEVNQFGPGATGENETTIYEDDRNLIESETQSQQQTAEEPDEEVIFRETVIKPDGETRITERITKSPKRRRREEGLPNAEPLVHNDERERSITKTSFSPERDVTQTTFYPSGNKIRTIIERNSQKRNDRSARYGNDDRVSPN